METHSLYRQKKIGQQWKKENLVKDDMDQGKNDYGKNGILFGLFSAPTFKSFF